MKRERSKKHAKPKPLHIVMFAAEASPYIKVGGLADVIGALPKELEKLGARVTVVIPAYKEIHHEMHAVHPYEPVPGFDLLMGRQIVHAEIFHTRMRGTHVDVFLIGCTNYFYRDGVYDDPLRREAYPDNMERFIFFMKAGLELIERLGRPLDVIHCHDWQAGLIPGLLKTTLKNRAFFAQSGTLISLHNVAYQGVFPREALVWAGIEPRHFYPLSPFEFWGKVNFLKVGIECSDFINTVSETYAREIQSSYEYGFGLEGVLRNRKEVLSGIVNGIDYEEWNPANDPLIPCRFSSGNLSGKAQCKSALQKYFGLPWKNHRTPLIGIVSRLASQKGFDLIEQAIGEITETDLQLVILGLGQQGYQDIFRWIASRNPQKIAVRIAFDNELAHLVEAGCDMFLMPSRYEPCGLSQMYSLRYGTVPIVRATGGLADTVVDYDGSPGSGTGFSFVNYSAEEMMAAVKRALALYTSDTRRWEELVLRGMSQDWSWERSASKYLELYRKVGRIRANPGQTLDASSPA